jgi:hypothetical protein
MQALVLFLEKYMPNPEDANLPPLAERPLNHPTGTMIVVTAPRCDLRDGITFHVPGFYAGERNNRDQVLVAAAIEFVGHHATKILPELTGFQGYACLKVTIEDQELMEVVATSKA